MPKTRKRNLKYDQAYYWPAWLAASLPAAERRLIPAKSLKNLCRANHDLWLALNLYDDCLDANQAGLALLKANKLYRRFLRLALEIGPDPLFDKAWCQIINHLEAANMRELTCFRLKVVAGKVTLPHEAPRFGPVTSLASKSWALGLAPAAIMQYLPSPHKERCLISGLKFFRLALAAKQLADDIKDWREDLENGHLTRANWQVIEHFKQPYLSFNKAADSQRLDYLFINRASQPLSRLLANLCKRARQAAQKCGWPPSSPLVNHLLAPIERGLEETRWLRTWLSQGGL